MDNEEFNKLCEEAKAQGLEDKDILAILIESLKKGDLSQEDLEKLAGALGYETTAEFKSLMSDATEEEGGDDVEINGEEVSEEEIEDAQEYGEGEEDEESEDEEESESESESEEDEEEDEEMSEEDEKKEARRLFDLD